MTTRDRRTRVALSAWLILVAGIDAHLTPQRGDGSSPAGRTGQPLPRPGGQTTITATAVIRGRVVSAANGAPIRAAEVRVRAADGRDNRLATSDDQGRFEVRDLTPGEWTVKASKAGFVSQHYGQNHPLEAATPIELANGQRFTADVTLIRGGAIGGHVVDEAGEPIAGVQVQAMRSRMVRGQRQLSTSGAGDRTDDTGAFRVYGLVPGDYYVAAILRAPEDMARGTTANVTMYFPGTRSILEAQRVPLAPGENQSSISIYAPRPSAGVEVSGIVISSTGASAAGASVHLYNADDLSMGTGSRGNFVEVDAAGRFTLASVAPGSYVVDAMTRPVPNMANFERAVAPVEVGSSNVDGLTVVTRAAVSLAGTIVAETGSTLPRALNVEMTVQSTDVSREMHINTAVAGNRFTIPGLFGRVALSVITNLPDEWTLKAIEINGEEVADVVDLTAVGPAANARIVLTDRVGEVSGTVTARGQPRTASVVVFPADSARWTYPSRFVRMGRTDADGKFRISGLPEQTYRIIAVSFLEEDEFQDTEFLERINKAATELSLREGEKKTIQLTVVQR